MNLVNNSTRSKNVQNHLNRFYWTTSERAIGRMLRNPETDHGAGAPQGFIPTDGGGGQPKQESQTPNKDGNNQPVITKQESSPANREDNTGDDKFDAASFWLDEPASERVPSPSDSAAPKPGGSSTSNQDDSKKDIGSVLLSEIESTKFEGVFNEDIAKKLGEGSFQEVNDAIVKSLQSGMKASLRHNARLLGEYGKMMLGKIEDLIEERIGSQVNSDYLVEQIPAAGSKTVGPAIRAIYDRALERTKGDRVEAVKQTKSMMRTLTTEMAGEVGLEAAPPDPHADRTATKTNWLEELAAR